MATHSRPREGLPPVVLLAGSAFTQTPVKVLISDRWWGVFLHLDGVQCAFRPATLKTPTGAPTIGLCLAIGQLTTASYENAL